ncbi:MAG: hypothetical protein HY897_15710 [Deltaproteobacteria bacterium]|nr:hypothetical protein [Deltaproteobacteria bacterium]
MRFFLQFAVLVALAGWSAVFLCGCPGDAVVFVGGAGTDRDLHGGFDGGRLPTDGDSETSSDAEIADESADFGAVPDGGDAGPEGDGPDGSDFDVLPLADGGTEDGGEDVRDDGGGGDGDGSEEDAADGGIPDSRFCVRDDSSYVPADTGAVPDCNDLPTERQDWCAASGDAGDVSGAADGDGGVPSWEYCPIDRFEGYAVTEGAIFVVFRIYYSSYGHFAVLDKAGNPTTELRTSFGNMSPPAIGPAGEVYVSAGEYLLELTSRVPDVQVFEGIPPGCIGGRPPPPAVAADGTVYVSYWCDDENYERFGGVGAVKNGAVLWRRTDLEVVNPLSVGYDGTVYAGTIRGEIVALNHDGNTKWEYRFPKCWSKVGEIAVTKDNGIVATIENVVFSFDSEGRKRWEVALDDDPWSFGPPVLDEEGNVVLLRYGGYGNDYRIYIVANCGVLKKKTAIDRHLSWLSPRVVVGSDGSIFVGGSEIPAQGVLLRFNKDLEPVPFDTASVIASGIDLVEMLGLAGCDEAYFVGYDRNKGRQCLYRSSFGNIGLAKSSWPMSRANVRNTGSAN